MTESPLKFSHIKLALKRQGLNYKLKHRDIDGSFGDVLTFIDAAKRIEVSGKIVRSFNAGEVYHWPTLNHGNLAPLIDVIRIDENLNIFITINQQTKLKHYIHEEDFVYDPRCFDRKKEYARGIFSGLSYLHGKSLCLMNLSDANIVICKMSDTAIISNFNCLMCSKRTTRSKLAVPNFYRAPETEKGDFDAMAAEMWASGVLMLDMFLAHMVPWTIVDCKPGRVMEIVDKLSYEVLQAANIGSVVKFLELDKLKVFLRCFFRTKPLARITAKLASIASFLRLTTYSSSANEDYLENYRNSDAKIVSKQINKQSFTTYRTEPHPSVTEFSHEIINKQIISPTYPCEQNISVKNSEHESTSKNVIISEKQQKLSNSEKDYASSLPSHFSTATKSSIIKGNQNLAQNPPSSNFPEEEIEIEVVTTESEIPLQKKIHNYTVKQENKLIKRTASFYYKTSKALKDSEAYSNVQLNLQSQQVIKTGYEHLNYKCHQSKSLSFIGSKNDENRNNQGSSSNKLDKSCSYSNIRSVSKRQSVINWQKSELYLDRLFNEGCDERNGSYRIEDIQGASENCDANNVQMDAGEVKEYGVASDQKGIMPVEENELNFMDAKSSEEADVNEFSSLAIRGTVKRIIFLQQCQASLQKHPILSTSINLAQEQKELLRKYQLLLHKEILRLLSDLRRNTILNLEETVELTRQIDETSGYFEDERNNLTPVSNRCSTPTQISNFHNDKLIKSDQHQLATIPTRDNNTHIKNLRPNRKYRRTIRSEDKWKLDGVKRNTEGNQIFTELNQSNDKLIGKYGESNKVARQICSTKPKVKYCRRKKIMNQIEEEATESAKSRISKDKTTTCSEMNKNERRKRAKEPRKSFFFSLCPGGWVEDPTPLPSVENLCHTCKLRFEDA